MSALKQAAAAPPSGVRAAPIEAVANDVAAFQTWTGPSIAAEIHSNTLADAYKQWLLLKGARQPRLRDMLASGSNKHDDMMLHLKLGDEYVIVHQSENYIRNLGRDLRGMLSSEVKLATAAALKKIFDDSLAQRQPIYVRYISSISDANVYWEVLVLPVAADDSGRPIFALTFVSTISEKVDILQLLYDRSPIGMIAAVPITNGGKKTDDARVLSMNAQARQILRLPPDGRQLYFLSEVAPLLRDWLNWVRAETHVDGNRTHVNYRTPDGEHMVMTIELINQFVLISIGPGKGIRFAGVR